MSAGFIMTRPTAKMGRQIRRWVVRHSRHRHLSIDLRHICRPPSYNSAERYPIILRGSLTLTLLN